jgi:hypothetical protein
VNVHARRDGTSLPDDDWLEAAARGSPGGHGMRVGVGDGDARSLRRTTLGRFELKDPCAR